MLKEIVDELKICNYKDDLGLLENHPAFIKLKELAELEEEANRLFCGRQNI